MSTAHPEHPLTFGRRCEVLFADARSKATSAGRPSPDVRDLLIAILRDPPERVRRCLGLDAAARNALCRSLNELEVPPARGGRGVDDSWLGALTGVLGAALALAQRAGDREVDERHLLIAI